MLAARVLGGAHPRATLPAVPVVRLAELPWTAVRDLGRSRGVAVLPVGALEAHGPHLPLATDALIAEAMAETGARLLADRGLAVLLLPALHYAAAPFARAFPGTVSIPGGVVAALVEGIGRALAEHGAPLLALANAHLDPEHLRSLHQAAAALRSSGGMRVAFPDLTRKPWALRLGEEFRSGACHAGRYEGSIVLALRPELVREEVRRGLAPNPASLSDAIRRGLGSFEAAGGPDAYFGDPAAASAEEGRRTIEELGRILDEAVTAELGDVGAPPR